MEKKIGNFLVLLKFFSLNGFIFKFNFKVAAFFALRGALGAGDRVYSVVRLLGARGCGWKWEKGITPSPTDFEIKFKYEAIKRKNLK